MSDLISRQAAIDAIHEDADWLAAQGSDWQRERMERDKSILMSLSSADAEWIPVSERLPIPPTFCLVTTDGGHGDVIDIALYMSDGWHKASEVLAWMPLPKPWEGDADDKE